MTTRIVLILQNDEPGTAGNGQTPVTVRLMIREPEGHAGLGTFDCVGSEEVFTALNSGGDGEVVAAAGQRLFQALARESLVKTILTTALQAHAPERWPLYLDVTGAEAAQDLPWEALCTEAGVFLSLTQWPVARMLASTAPAAADRRLSPPLRLAAVLSCLEVDPRDEWTALRAAVESSPIPVTVLLFLSDTALRDQLNDEHLPWLTIRQVPLEYLDLQQEITNFEPHLLHFLAHGDTAGRPHLQVATAADVQAGIPVYIHRLEAESIRHLVRQPKEPPWAVVLNACTTAAAVVESGARSLAASLVRDHGMQAVIGMREPVLSTDAAKFAGAFYRELFADIAAGGELDWAATTVSARAELCRSPQDVVPLSAARHRQWILPVVTVRPAPFRMKVTPATVSSEIDRLLADFKATLLASLPATTPAATVAAFQPAGTGAALAAPAVNG
jgi:hypothetical protein